MEYEEVKREEKMGHQEGIKAITSEVITDSQKSDYGKRQEAKKNGMKKLQRKGTRTDSSAPEPWGLGKERIFHQKTQGFEEIEYKM